jgi:Ca-activated chloride channel family protein
LSVVVAGSVVLGATDKPTVFRGGVDLVALNVVVTDGQNKPVSGLSSEDFTVLEDGVPQDVSFFAAQQVPLDLAILLDTSASMMDKMHTAQDAAVGFAMRLHQGDRISIVSIKDGVKIVHPLDENIDEAITAIRETTAGGGTALYNGVYMTLREMMRRRDGNALRRQAIAVLSDGDDTASLVSFDDVMDVAKQAGIAIYTIMLRSGAPLTFSETYGKKGEAESQFAMKALALETGARSFFPTDILELAGVYGAIADDLASQYSIGYTSKNARQDGAYRRVSVRVDQPNTRTRTRAGYVAARSSRAVASSLQ